MGSVSVLPAGSLFAGVWPGYFAPVDRADALPVPFDPAAMGRFALDAPPAGWLSVGEVAGLERSSTSVLTAVESGAPAVVKTQVRSTVGEELKLTFPAWSRVAMALSSGVQGFNLLRTASGANANPSGGAAAAAEAVGAGSTATVLQLAAGMAVQAGDVVVVDVDYTGTTGYVGSGAPGAYVAAAPSVVDAQYVRRVSSNVARVLSVAAGVVTLASALPAGVPSVGGSGMKVAIVEGFVDRAGGAFLPEWSGLFVLDGVQGDRLLLHYPRLQSAGGGAEMKVSLAAGVDRWRSAAHLRVLPVVDANDGALSVCFRSYLPAPLRAV